MTYTPPDRNSIEFELVSGYTAPDIDNISFDMSGEPVAPTAVVSDFVSGQPDIQAIHPYITWGEVYTQDLISGNPDIANIVVWNPACSITDITTGAPNVPGIIVFNPACAISNIVTGAPTIVETHAYILFGFVSIPDLETGLPEISEISVRNVIAYPQDVFTGAPVIPSPIALADAIHIDEFLTGAPDIPLISVSSIGAQVPDFIIGYPDIPNITVLQMSGNTSISDIITGLPDIHKIVVELIGAKITDFTTGLPDIGTPVVESLTASPIDVASGIPDIETPAGMFFPLITENSHIVYLCTLTGSPDLELPISSFQGRLRSGSNSYLSVVVPGTDNAEDIADRSDGQIVMEVAYLINGIIRQRTEIIRVNLSNIKAYKGIKNKSIILTGYRQKTYAPQEIELKDATYMAVIDGEYRYRFATPNLDLQPGDTVTVGSDTFRANVISYFVSASTGGFETQMEISES